MAAVERASLLYTVYFAALERASLLYTVYLVLLVRGEGGGGVRAKRKIIATHRETASTFSSRINPRLFPAASTWSWYVNDLDPLDKRLAVYRQCTLTLYYISIPKHSEAVEARGWVSGLTLFRAEKHSPH